MAATGAEDVAATQATAAVTQTGIDSDPEFGDNGRNRNPSNTGAQDDQQQTDAQTRRPMQPDTTQVQAQTGGSQPTGTLAAGSSSDGIDGTGAVRAPPVLPSAPPAWPHCSVMV